MTDVDTTDALLGDDDGEDYDLGQDEEAELLRDDEDEEDVLTYQADPFDEEEDEGGHRDKFASERQNQIQQIQQVENEQYSSHPHQNANQQVNDYNRYKGNRGRGRGRGRGGMRQHFHSHFQQNNDNRNNGPSGRQCYVNPSLLQKSQVQKPVQSVQPWLNQPQRQATSYVPQMNQDRIVQSYCPPMNQNTTWQSPSPQKAYFPPPQQQQQPQPFLNHGQLDQSNYYGNTQQQQGFASSGPHPVPQYQGHNQFQQPAQDFSYGYNNFTPGPQAANPNYSQNLMQHNVPQQQQASFGHQQPQPPMQQHFQPVVPQQQQQHQLQQYQSYNNPPLLQTPSQPPQRQYYEPNQSIHHQPQIMQQQQQQQRFGHQPRFEPPVRQQHPEQRGFNQGRRQYFNNNNGRFVQNVPIQQVQQQQQQQHQRGGAGGAGGGYQHYQHNNRNQFHYKRRNDNWQEEYPKRRSWGNTQYDYENETNYEQEEQVEQTGNQFEGEVEEEGGNQVDNNVEQSPEIEEDEETKAYRLKIEEQKQKRAAILALKEKNRKLAIRKKNDPTIASATQKSQQQQTIQSKQPLKLVQPALLTKPLITSTRVVTNTNSNPNLRMIQMQELPSAGDTVVKPSASDGDNPIKISNQFLAARKVIAKDDKLLDTPLVVVRNLAASTAEPQLRKLCQGVGLIQSFEMSTKERQATIRFKSVASAHAFYKKYQRHMLDLSMIQVELVPIAI